MPTTSGDASPLLRVARHIPVQLVPDCRFPLAPPPRGGRAVVSSPRTGPADLAFGAFAGHLRQHPDVLDIAGARARQRGQQRLDCGLRSADSGLALGQILVGLDRKSRKAKRTARMTARVSAFDVCSDPERPGA